MILQDRKQINGLLLIDKSEAITSHDAVDEVRRLLRIKKVGHTGTLDPFATGLLVLCVGKATRVSEYITMSDKEYLATICFGKETDTDDVEGEVIDEPTGEVVDNLSASDIQKAVDSFTGTFFQLPPNYSAVKVKGKKAYEEARKGNRIQLPFRKVTVYELQVLNYNLPKLQCRISCSSGTYIRALARDIGRNLRCGGHLSSLRRTRVGYFCVQDAITLDKLEKVVESGDLDNRILPMSSAVDHLQEILVSNSGLKMLYQGRRIRQDEVVTNMDEISMEDMNDKELRVKIPDQDGELGAIGTLQRSADGEMILRPEKVFLKNESIYRT